MNIKNQKAFSLIELLVVITIIGILSTVASVSLGSSREKARDAKRLSDIKQIQTSLEMYYDAKRQYPEGGDICITDTPGDYIKLDPSKKIESNGVIFMAKIPLDPLDTGSSMYKYKRTSAKTYELLYQLETDSFFTKEKVLVATQNAICDPVATTKNGGITSDCHRPNP